MLQYANDQHIILQQANHRAGRGGGQGGKAFGKCHLNLPSPEHSAWVINLAVSSARAIFYYVWHGCSTAEQRTVKVSVYLI